VSLPAHAELVDEEVLLDFVARQRWFGAKGSDVVSARILDGIELRHEPLLVDALVEVRYGSGTHDVYQLVFGVGDEDEAFDHPIASRDGRTVYEAAADHVFARELMHLVRSGSTVAVGEGSVEFSSLDAAALTGADLDNVRPIGLEQTNSSFVVGEQLIVKIYRRVEAGVNPEVELLRFFAAHDFDRVPRLQAWWSYAGHALNASLGVAQEFVPAAIDGWSLALQELGSEPEEFLARTGRLGTVVGEMHAVLGSDATDPAFAPEDASQESLALLTATVDEEIDAVFLDLPDVPEVQPISGLGDALRDVLRGLSAVGSTGKRIRHHGDLHLGQAIWAEDDWLIIDFEGEPARPLPERRLKRSPLRDVAGMLRSFTYAAQVSQLSDPTIEQQARERFLEGYLDAMRESAILPPRETTERLLRIFELEKAVYELRYELAHRPDWVSIPVAGILRLLEESAG
jgi:maltokinase